MMTIKSKLPKVGAEADRREPKEIAINSEPNQQISGKLDCMGTQLTFIPQTAGKHWDKTYTTYGYITQKLTSQLLNKKAACST